MVVVGVVSDVQLYSIGVLLQNFDFLIAVVDVLYFNFIEQFLDPVYIFPYNITPCADS